MSVSDKSGLEKLARWLSARSATIYATGSTYSYLMGNGYDSNLKRVSELTQWPEFIGGRVKTLHPKIHGAILADQRKSEHLKELADLKIPTMDLVVSNLYPFEQTISHEDCTEDIAIENIDIGGPTMVRAAAKNYHSIYILTNPDQYSEFMNIYQDNKNLDDQLEYRRRLAKSAFDRITQYDTAISDYLSDPVKLKYGLNPQQPTAHLTFTNPEDPAFKILSGKIGYINVLDAVYAWNLVREIADLTADRYAIAASFKHTSPAGVGSSYKVLSSVELEAYFRPTEITFSPAATAFLRARGTDPKSSFGDFIAISCEVDKQTAELIRPEVSDGIIARSYTSEAIEILKNKKGGNYLVLQGNTNLIHQTETREMHGVKLSQDANTAIVNLSDLEANNCVTMTKCTDKEQQFNLLLAMMTLKYTQSNSVCFTYSGQTVGVGAGQQSRIDCVQLAGQKAGIWKYRQHPEVLEYAKTLSGKRADKVNAVIKYIQEHPELETHELPLALASDAFFPFRDNIDCAAKYGVKAILQPGGSKGDESVIEACDQYEISMYLCKKRFFLH